MKNKIALIVLITVITILSSCEGGTTFTKSVDNNSSETITIKLHTIYGTNDAVTINPNESKQIYWDDQMGRFVDDAYTCTQFIDSVEISIINNKVLTKDIMNSNNWTNTSKGGRNSREDCKFSISNEDLQ